MVTSIGAGDICWCQFASGICPLLRAIAFAVFGSAVEVPIILDASQKKVQ